MSHFTHMKTRFQNLFYLEKALKKLDIVYKQEKNPNSEFHYVNLVIPQSNGSDIKFAWNSQTYELITDMSFWDQGCIVENFVDRIAQQYASEAISDQGQKIGFKSITSELNRDGSKVLFLQRWRSNTY